MVIEVGKNVPYASLSPVQSYSLKKRKQSGSQNTTLSLLPKPRCPTGVASTWKSGWIFKLARSHYFQTICPQSCCCPLRWSFFLNHMKVPFRLGVDLNTTVREKSFEGSEEKLGFPKSFPSSSEHITFPDTFD